MECHSLKPVVGHHTISQLLLLNTGTIHDSDLDCKNDIGMSAASYLHSFVSILLIDLSKFWGTMHACMHVLQNLAKQTIIYIDWNSWCRNFRKIIVSLPKYHARSFSLLPHARSAQMKALILKELSPHKRHLEDCRQALQKAVDVVKVGISKLKNSKKCYRNLVKCKVIDDI